jgi:hypothetical protein
MPGYRRLLALVLGTLLLATSVRGADVLTAKGEVVKGEVVSVSDKELVLDHSGKRETMPLTNVLRIDLREAQKPAPPATWADVELTDGTLLHASKWALKKNQIEATLLSGPTVTVPLSSISSILNEAQVEANRRDWNKRIAGKRASDVMVVTLKGVIQGVECTFGAGDETGETIEVTATLGGEVQTFRRKLATLQGLIFRRTLDSKAPPAVCKVLDTMSDVVMVSEVVYGDKEVKLATPAGARLTFPTEQVARLDYTKVRLDYLSELEPITLITRSNVEDGDKAEQQHVYRDVSLKGDKAQISLGGVTYSKGLALRPYTEMTFDLKGEYQEFSAVVGLDDNVGTVGETVLVIEADGTVLETITFRATDKKKFQKVTRNIKDVLRLRIVVKSGDDFDLGKHLDLADAKVSK